MVSSLAYVLLSQASVKITFEDGKARLYSRGESIVLDPNTPTAEEVSLNKTETLIADQDGNVVTYDDGIESGRLHMEPISKAWLNNDSLWSSHSRANSLKGNKAWVSQLVVAEPKGRTVLGVLNIQSMSRSSQPVLSQVLVRFDSFPLRATFVADIGLSDNPKDFVHSPNPRLFAFKNQIAVFMPDGLHLITNGSKIQSQVALPVGAGDVAKGQTRAGTIVTHNTTDNTARIWRNGKASIAIGTNPAENLIIDANSTSDLVQIGDKIIDPETGKSIKKPGVNMLWQDLALEWREKTCLIYDGKSGRKLITYRI